MLENIYDTYITYINFYLLGYLSVYSFSVTLMIYKAVYNVVMDVSVFFSFALWLRFLIYNFYSQNRTELNDHNLKAKVQMVDFRGCSVYMDPKKS